MRGVQQWKRRCKKIKENEEAGPGTRDRFGSDPGSDPRNPNRFRVRYKGCNPNFPSFFTLHSLSSLSLSRLLSFLSPSRRFMGFPAASSSPVRSDRATQFPARWPPARGGGGAAPEVQSRPFFQNLNLFLRIFSSRLHFYPQKSQNLSQ